MDTNTIMLPNSADVSLSPAEDGPVPLSMEEAEKVGGGLHMYYQGGDLVFDWVRP
jgi:hypothetical protein